MIIEHEGKRYKVIEEIKEPEKEKVIINGWDLTEYEKWYDRDYCLEAVKQNGYDLQFVKQQDKEICLEAVKQNGLALRYVKQQDKEICLEAVKQNGYDLQFVDKRVFLEE